MSSQRKAKLALLAAGCISLSLSAPPGNMHAVMQGVLAPYQHAWPYAERDYFCGSNAACHVTLHYKFATSRWAHKEILQTRCPGIPYTGTARYSAVLDCLNLRPSKFCISPAGSSTWPHGAQSIYSHAPRKRSEALSGCMQPIKAC